MKWLLLCIGADVGILLLGALLHGPYLRHLRHHHRPHWEAISRRAPRSWRYYKGMPTTGMLISTFIGDREYRHEESRGYLQMGRLIVLLNLLHVAVICAIVILALMELL